MISDGLVIENIGGNCPVQAEGTIDGHPFYFRARGAQWSVDIAAPGRDPLNEAIWGHWEAWGNSPYAAGWMPEDTARAMIAKAAAMWRLRG